MKNSSSFSTPAPTSTGLDTGLVGALAAVERSLDSGSQDVSNPANWPAIASHAIVRTTGAIDFFLGRHDAETATADLSHEERLVTQFWVWDWGPQRVLLPFFLAFD